MAHIKSKQNEILGQFQIYTLHTKTVNIYRNALHKWILQFYMYARFSLREKSNSPNSQMDKLWCECYVWYFSLICRIEWSVVSFRDGLLFFSRKSTKFVANRPIFPYSHGRVELPVLSTRFYSCEEGAR